MPESRIEQYLANLLNGEGELPEKPESRNEQYLLLLCQKGLVSVVANPDEVATADLEKLKINGVVFGVALISGNDDDTEWNKYFN